MDKKKRGKLALTEEEAKKATSTAALTEARLMIK
jgi:hypothetical protein